MKAKYLVLTFLLLAGVTIGTFIIASSETGTQRNYTQKTLKDGDSISFGIHGSKKGLVSADYKKESNDGDKLHLIETSGKLNLESYARSDQPNFDQVEAYNVYGSVEMIKDTAVVILHSSFKRLYLIDKFGKTFRTFESSVKLQLVAHSKQGKPATFDLSSMGTRLCLTSIPYKVSRNRIFEEKHKPKHLANFTYIVVYGTNTVDTLTTGDWLFVGANEFQDFKVQK